MLKTSRNTRQGRRKGGNKKNRISSGNTNHPLPHHLRHKSRPVGNAEFPVNIGSVFFHRKLGTENMLHDLLIEKARFSPLQTERMG
jgi:hypothetical protein